MGSYLTFSSVGPSVNGILASDIDGSYQAEFMSRHRLFLCEGESVMRRAGCEDLLAFRVSGRILLLFVTAIKSLPRPTARPSGRRAVLYVDNSHYIVDNTEKQC